MSKLTKAQRSVLENIEREPRPCLCQFGRVGWAVKSLGLIEYHYYPARCHSAVRLTDAGRAALQEPQP